MSIDVEATYERYGPMVLRRCRRLLRDEARAVDALHDTFVRLLQSRDRLDDASPSSLLYRMATNVCLNHLRSQRRRPEDPDDARLMEIAMLDDVEDRALAAGVLRRIFDREVPSTRTIAVLHFVDGMTHEEVAREVGLSVSGVRKRLRRLEAQARIATAEGSTHEA